MTNYGLSVMAGLDPAIHVFLVYHKDVDDRDKFWHDEEGWPANIDQVSGLAMNRTAVGQARA